MNLSDSFSGGFSIIRFTFATTSAKFILSGFR